MQTTKTTKTTPTPENHLDMVEQRWFAVYTRPKSEKVVKHLLDVKGVETYLPLLEVTRRYTRKIKVLHLPLISCYIFVRIVKSQYVPVLETENVVKFIRFSRNLIAIPEEEINILRMVVGEVKDLEAQAGLLKEGDRVEIIGGKLTGIKGHLVEKQGKKKMVIALENIGYSLTMTVDAALLRKVT